MGQPPTIPLKTCLKCQFPMPETAAFCPGCGRSMDAELPVEQPPRSGSENVLGAVAYLTFLPAIVFLFVDPYRTNRYLRFHSVQCLLLCAAGLMFALLLRLVGMVLFLIPLLGPLLVVLLNVVMILALFLVWLVLMVKAFQGQMFRIPLLGDFAERYADVL
jgi:uncharacterized membrane protein